MKIGVSKVCTSTTDPRVRLAGFGNPARVFKGMHDDIWVRAMVLEQDGQRVAFVTGDVLGFEQARIEELRADVKEKANLDVDAILFNASHTHSAPNVMRGQSPKIGAYLAEYADWWYTQVLAAIVAAVQDLEDGTLSYGFTDCYGIGINRRRMLTGSYEFAPYEAGIRRDEAFVLKADCGGRTKAVLVKHTCHPSTIGFDYGSGDWPGVMRREVESRYPGVTALFMQGCCGNIRVRTVKDANDLDHTSFRGGTYDDIETFGKMLADAVDRILGAPMTPVTGKIASKKIFFELPLQEKRPREYYAANRDDTLEGWSNGWYFDHYDTLPETLPYSMQRIDLGDHLTFIALEGEVVVEYEYHMDKLLPERKVITAGYSNGNPGYICTAVMYPQGGYEPHGSAVCYFLRDGWKPESEQIILENAQRLK